MISIEEKEVIIEKFYEEHLKPSVIAKELGVNPSYVTKIIQKDSRYTKFSRRNGREIRVIKIK